MVYDDRGNFIGDTHWREDYDFGDGEELTLERGGVIVQVAECVGSREQDLSELVDKRAQERAERQSAAIARRPPIPEAITSQVAAPHFQLRHKPLHQLIGTPTGHHGRALISNESPYEARQKPNPLPQTESPRPPKRRRREPSPPSKNGYARSLFGAALTLSATPTSTPTMQNGAVSLGRAVGIREQDLQQRKIAEDLVMETDHSRRLSVTELSDPEVDGPNSLLARESRGRFNDRSSVAHLRSKEVSKPSLASRPQSSTPATGPLSESRRQKKAQTLEINKERQTISHEFPSEPRTELRIKPRKKRGLLMITESLGGTTKSRIDRQNSSTTSEYRSDMRHSSAGRNEDTPETLDYLDQTEAIETSKPKDSSQDDTNKSRKGSMQPTREDKTVRDRSVDGRSIVRCDEVQHIPNKAPAPRLVPLGRKGIRSKEIIGFVLDDEEADICSVPEAQSNKKIVGDDSVAPKFIRNPDTATPDRHPLGDQGRSESAWISTETEVQAEVGEDTTTIARPPPKGPVINPATRGKKAAKPSDAAGQVPQCPLPPEVAVKQLLGSGVHGANMRNRRGTGLESRTKGADIIPMPEFSRASGGAWSREAHDLFEFTRPP